MCSFPARTQWHLTQYLTGQTILVLAQHSQHRGLAVTNQSILLYSFTLTPREQSTPYSLCIPVFSSWQVKTHTKLNVIYSAQKVWNYYELLFKDSNIDTLFLSTWDDLVILLITKYNLSFSLTSLFGLGCNMTWTCSGQASKKFIELILSEDTMILSCFTFYNLTQTHLELLKLVFPVSADLEQLSYTYTFCQDTELCSHIYHS